MANPKPVVPPQVIKNAKVNVKVSNKQTHLRLQKSFEAWGRDINTGKALTERPEWTKNQEELGKYYFQMKSVPTDWEPPSWAGEAISSKRFGWQPPVASYKTNYWDNPRRIGRYYWALKTKTDGDIPSWMDKDTIETAYNYFQAQNPGKPWYEWSYPKEDDPVRGFLADLQMPPAEALPDNERGMSEWSQ